MPRLEQVPSRNRPHKVSPASQIALDTEELSDYAIRAIAEGRADHAAGRTFTMAEIKRELGISSPAEVPR